MHCHQYWTERCACIRNALGIEDVASRGKAVQVFNPVGNGFKLDEIALASVLEKVQDTPVAVVSVAGAFRKGKSFLLNFFRKFLTHIQREVSGLMLRTPTKALAAFYTYRSLPHPTNR